MASRRRARPPARPAPAPPRQVRARGHAYERTSYPSPLAPRPVVHRSRTAGSQVTFGLGGRLACTALLAAPTVLLLVRGTLLWLLLSFVSWVAAVPVLRDVWWAVDVTDDGPRRRPRRRPFTL